ncbi:integrase core domain-containing protein, partial [Salipiger sp. 1_MG-2023]|uniref:integrase core domain-containing protein n=1 Tax=Salipiger sp. 1_MG-2023 TaxID=3062665 RepID=UPI0026E3D0E5
QRHQAINTRSGRRLMTAQTPDLTIAPWTNGQAERMNRTIKEATVKRYHYDSHDQLRTHLADFMAAYNFARRLKTLSGLTPYEYICKIWTSEPDSFIIDPIHQMPGLNS